jgi:hypothetical protein
MISELTDFLYKYKKEVALIIVTAATTFIFTKALPTLFALIKELAVYLFAILTGQRKEYKFEKQYLNWLINEHKYLATVPSQIVNPDKLPRQPELEDVYIQLQLKQAHEKLIDVPAADLAKKSAKTVVLGDPGSGKTTLLRYMCLTYARLASTPIFFYKKRQHLKSRFDSRSGRVPILIYLNRLAGTDINILSTMEAMLPESLHAIYPKDYFNKLLDTGRAIILLDGLDEVPSQTDRNKVAQAIGSLSNASNNNNIWIVTSRIVGYKAQLHHSFVTAIVQPLTPAQVEGFILQWYQRKFLVSGFPTDELEYQKEIHDRRAKHLVNTLKLNSGLASLATNPMLVSLIALLHSVQIELPENRALLYRDCVELLADRWDLFRGIQQADNLEVAIHQKISLLISIAWYMHENRLKEIKRSELENIISSQLSKISKSYQQLPSRKILDTLEERSGLLITRGMTESGEKIMAFSHLSFQEYLAAASLSQGTNTTAKKVLAANSNDPWWREPILLYVAQLDAPAFVIEQIYNDSFKSKPLDHLLLAASCLCEVKEDKTNELYTKIFCEVSTLYSCGEFRPQRFDLLRTDKHNLLLRHMIDYLKKFSEQQILGLEIFLAYTRGTDARELAEKFIRNYDQEGEITDIDLNLIKSIFRVTSLDPSHIISLIFKYPRRLNTNAISWVSSSYTLGELVSVAMNSSNWVNILDKVYLLSLLGEQDLKPALPPENNWKSFTINRVANKSRLMMNAPQRRLSASSGPPEYGEYSSQLSSISGLLINQQYSAAATLLEEMPVLSIPSSSMSNSISELYEQSDHSVAQCFCIILICRFQSISSQLAESLMHFVSGYLHVWNDVSHSLASSTTTELLIVNLMQWSLKKLVDYQGTTKQYIKFLVKCCSSDVQEAVDFAALKISELETIESDAVAQLLEILNSELISGMPDSKSVSSKWASLLILPHVAEVDDQIITNIVFNLHDKEHSFQGKSIGEIAANSLLFIISKKNEQHYVGTDS